MLKSVHKHSTNLNCHFAEVSSDQDKKDFLFCFYDFMQKKIQVVNDQKMAQSERNSHSEN